MPRAANDAPRGAFADLLIVDGDPTRDATVLSRPDAAIKLVMKAGKVVRNALAGASDGDQGAM